MRSEKEIQKKSLDDQKAKSTKRATLDPKEKKVLEQEKSKDTANLEKHLTIAKMNWASAELKADEYKDEVKSLK